MTPPRRFLPYVLAAVALAFVSVTVLSQFRTAAIDEGATEIATNAAPSIEELTVARSEARQLHLLLREELDDAQRGSHPDPAPAVAMRQQFDAQIAHDFTRSTGDRAIDRTRPCDRA